MKKAALLIMGLCASMIWDKDAMAQSGDLYKWKYRPVLVFAPDAGNDALARQKQIVRSSAGAFRERDIVVIYVVGDDVSADLGPAPGSDAQGLRRRYGVDANRFAALLVGKDGGVKLKSSSPLSASRLSSVIDAMPMRRQEMRR